MQICFSVLDFQIAFLVLFWILDAWIERQLKFNSNCKLSANSFNIHFRADSSEFQRFS